VHGAAAVTRAEHSARVLFQGDDLSALSDDELREAFAHSPSTPLARAALGTPEAALAVLLALAELAPSRGQARKDIAAGGVYVNNRRVVDPGHVLSAADVVAQDFIILRRGKRSYHVVRLDARAA
jgi:tyrosyl-tRNA synthetase